MKFLKKFFVSFMVFGLLFMGNMNVEASDLKLDFQELRSSPIMPILPDRIRHRNDSHKLQRPSQRRINLPHEREQPPARYIQRQPKNPPKMTTPSRPSVTSDRRGSQPRKNFGPPNFH